VTVAESMSVAGDVSMLAVAGAMSVVVAESMLLASLDLFHLP
jgi:hypothetical protein